MSDFEKFKKKLSGKEKFYSSLTDRKITDKEYEHILNVYVDMQYLKRQTLSLNLFQILTWIYSLRKVQEVEFLLSYRYIKANDKYLKYDDPKQESRHIIYLDANNLYGYTMSKFLPTSGLKWIDPSWYWRL